MTVHEALVWSTEELQRRIRDHQDLLVRAMKGGDGEVRIDPGLLLDCPHRRRLRETLKETIEILEDTRRAFKSKRLEALRKKLIGVLTENA